uniref:Proline-rich proteoglycan 2-like isoform X1 n=1 Tax=Crassostrea virginica TaxID=6565 RepID=A0A8B8E9S0_CRAVI|nr:proline-rich proteoglycan 2-like isoform X1 [Crassostrea virginica]
MPLIAVLIAVFGLPACASVPTPTPPSILDQHAGGGGGCYWEGKFYSPGDEIHRTENGDCVHTLTCAEGGYPIAGDSRGCFRDKREATENAGPPPQEPETPPEPLAPSLDKNAGPSPQEPETPPEPLAPSLDKNAGPSPQEPETQVDKREATENAGPPPQEPETPPEPLAPSLDKNAGPPPQEPETPPEPLAPSLDKNAGPSPQEPETPPESLAPSLDKNEGPPPQKRDAPPEPLAPSLPILNVETPSSGAIKDPNDDTEDDDNVDDNKEDVARAIEDQEDEDEI